MPIPRIGTNTPLSNVFWVPKEARWPHLQANAAQPTIGKLNDEIKVRERKNIVQARNLSEMLEDAIRRYQSRTLDTAQRGLWS